MAVISVRHTQTGPNAWLLSWQSSGGDGSPYRIFVDGVLVGEQFTSNYVLTLDLGESAHVEILDTTTDRPTFAAQSQIELGFDQAVNAASYKVERDSGAGFVTEGHLKPSTSGRQKWKSEPLDADLSHTFRVTPTGINGNVGSQATVTGKLIRHPDPPVVAMAYNGAGPRTVTIS